MLSPRQRMRNTTRYITCGGIHQRKALPEGVVPAAAYGRSNTLHNISCLTDYPTRYITFLAFQTAHLLAKTILDNCLHLCMLLSSRQMYLASHQQAILLVLSACSVIVTSLWLRLSFFHTDDGFFRYSWMLAKWAFPE